MSRRRLRALIVAWRQRIRRHCICTLAASSIAPFGFLLAVLFTFKRPQIQATTALSLAHFTVRQDRSIRPVLASAITKLTFSRFETLVFGDKRCFSRDGDGSATLTLPKGALGALTLGAGKWSLAVGQRDAPSRGAFTLTFLKPSLAAEVYADMEAGLTGTLKVTNCEGYQGEAGVQFGGRLQVNSRPDKTGDQRRTGKEPQGVQVYAGYGDPLNVPVFSEICVDEISGTVASEWVLQREYWETCVLSANTKLRVFELRASEDCPPPETPQVTLGKELGGIRLIDLGLDHKQLEARFRWPDGAQWTPGLDAACTYTFWKSVSDRLK